MLQWGFSFHYADSNVLLEIRNADGDFTEYKTTDISLKLLVYNREDSTFADARIVRLPRDASVLDLRKLVAPLVGCSVEETRLVLEGTSYQACKHLDGNGHSLRAQFYIYGGESIIADNSLLSDSAPAFFATDLAKAVDRRTNTITVHVVLPGEEESSEGAQTAQAHLQRVLLLVPGHRTPTNLLTFPGLVCIAGIAVDVDQRMKLGAWKTELCRLVEGLAEEEFTVHRVGLSSTTELTRQTGMISHRPSWSKYFSYACGPHVRHTFSAIPGATHLLCHSWRHSPSLSFLALTFSVIPWSLWLNLRVQTR